MPIITNGFDVKTVSFNGNSNINKVYWNGTLVFTRSLTFSYMPSYEGESGIPFTVMLDRAAPEAFTLKFNGQFFDGPRTIIGSPAFVSFNEGQTQASANGTGLGYFSWNSITGVECTSGNYTVSGNELIHT